VRFWNIGLCSIAENLIHSGFKKLVPDLGKPKLLEGLVISKNRNYKLTNYLL